VSAHLLAATPTCHWLEFVDWAAPILEEPLRVKEGLVFPPEKLAWNEQAIRKFLL
jgi:mandelate racemase